MELLRLVYIGIWLECMKAKLILPVLEYYLKKDAKHCMLLLPCVEKHQKGMAEQ